MPVLLGLRKVAAPPPVPGSVDVRANDTRWGYSNSGFNTSGNTFVATNTAGRDTWSTFRFVLNIPQGATITNATFTPFAHNNGMPWASILTPLVMGAEQADNPTPFSSSPDAIARYLNVGTTVNWMEAGGSGVPSNLTSGSAIEPGTNIAAVIQQIVNRPGWESGNTIQLIIRNTGPAGASYGWHPAQAAENLRPRLQVDFLSGGGPIPPTQLYVYPTSAADTTCRTTGGLFLTNPLYMLNVGNPLRGVYRFPNVTVPAGATIVDARISFVISYFSPSPTNSTPDDYKDLGVEMVANSPQVSSGTDLWDRAGATTNRVRWMKADMGNAALQRVTSPNLASRIQSVIDLPGWASGNAISVFYIDSPTVQNGLAGESYYTATNDGVPERMPRLELTYSME